LGESRLGTSRGRRFWIFGVVLSLALIGSGLGVLVWEFETVEKVELGIAGWIYVPVGNGTVQGVEVTVRFQGQQIPCGVDNFGVTVKRGNDSCMAITYHTLQKVDLVARRRWSVLRGTLAISLAQEEQFEVAIHAETTYNVWYVLLPAVSMTLTNNSVWLNTLDLGEA